MAHNDSEASPPATGRDAARAADLLTDAAIADRQSDPELRAATVQAAMDVLDHHHADVRAAAASALARLGALDNDTAGRLLDDRSSLVRRRTIEVLTAGIAPDSPRWLLDLLLGALDDEPSVAEPAAFAIGEFGPRHELFDAATAIAVERRLAAMATGHGEALCREAAVAALGALHRGRAEILAALSDRATVRRRAVIALAPFDGDDVDVALATCRDDRDWQVRQAAEDQIRVRAGDSTIAGDANP